MASVRKLDPDDPKSPWVVEYTDGAGKRRRKTPKSGLKKDAEALRQKIERDMGDGVHIPARQSCTVRQLAPLFLEACERRAKIGGGMTFTTLAGYRNFVDNYIVRTFGDRKLSALASEDVENWLALLRQTKSPKTVVRARLILKLLLDYAIKQKLLARNVIVDGKVSAPNVNKRYMSIPSVEEVKRLLDIANTHKKFRGYKLAAMNRSVAVHLSVMCGLRAGEVAGLDWDKVDFATETLTVARSHSRKDGMKEPKTEAGIRRLPLPPQATASLQRLADCSRKPLDGPVLVTRGGERYFGGDVWRLWREVARAAGLVNADGGLKYRFHDLRHTAISALIADGLNPVHIKKFAGHSKVSTTMDIYAHLFPEDDSIRESVKNVANRFSA